MIFDDFNRPRKGTSDGHEDDGKEIVAIVLMKGNVALGRPQGGHEDDGNNIIAIVLVRGKAAAMRTIAMIPFRIIAIVLMKGILIDFRYPDQSGARGGSFLQKVAQNSHEL